MGMNFKPINEVPEITEISEGDKLLVNSGGAAKQIDASKVGGGGGGASADLIHIGVEDMENMTNIQAMAYADADGMIPMTYAHGKAALLAGNAIQVHSDAAPGEAGETYLFPALVQAVDAAKAAMVVVAMGPLAAQIALLFSDTEGV